MFQPLLYAEVFVPLFYEKKKKKVVGGHGIIFLMIPKKACQSAGDVQN